MYTNDRQIFLWFLNIKHIYLMFTIKQNKICFKLYIRKAVTKVFSFYDLIRPVLPQALFKKVKQICLRDKIDLQIDIFLNQ